MNNTSKSYDLHIDFLVIEAPYNEALFARRQTTPRFKLTPALLGSHSPPLMDNTTSKADPSFARSP